MILEKIKSLFEKAPKPESKIISNRYLEEQNEVTFAKLIEYRERTPQIHLAVSTYKNLITGTEIQINADDPKAKKLIEDWNANTNFFEKFSGVVDTVLTCGAAILEKLDEVNTVDVAEVDMKIVQGKKRDEFGNLQYYVVNDQFGTRKLGENRLQKFIEFNLTNYSRQPWGRSLFYSLAVPRTVDGRQTRPLVELLWAIQDAEAAIMVNHAYPEVYYVFQNADEKRLESEARKIKTRKPGDRMLVTESPEIKVFETQPNSKYTDFIADIKTTIELGTQFPHDILTGNFTSRASSETTETLVMRLVRGYQKYLANKLKTELYDAILVQNGIDPLKANLSVSFAVQEVNEMTLDQVHKLYTDKAITLNEYRYYLKTKAQALDLFDTVQEPVEETIICKKCKSGVHESCTKRRCQCQHEDSELIELRKEAYRKVIQSAQEQKKEQFYNSLIEKMKEL